MPYGGVWSWQLVVWWCGGVVGPQRADTRRGFLLPTEIEIEEEEEEEEE
jgi:hypothetical protein